MKIFEKDGKINFVDDRNVFVGFDHQQSCCEDFGWSITPERPKELEGGNPEMDVTGYVFDPDFFEDSLPGDVYTEDGGVAVFRMVRGGDQLFLTLWNFHNGYYGHGFAMETNGETVRSGCL